MLISKTNNGFMPIILAFEIYKNWVALSLINNILKRALFTTCK